MDRDKRLACERVLCTLRNPLMMMSVPDREDALTLARIHNMTAEDLLLVARDRARRA